jgi:hypothetical protein
MYPRKRMTGTDTAPRSATLDDEYGHGAYDE